MGDHYYYDYDSENPARYYPGRNAVNNIIDHHSENKTAYGTLYLGIAAVSAVGCTLFYFYRKKRRENLGYNRTSSEILNQYNLDDSDVPLVSARTNSDSNMLTPRALRSDRSKDESWLDEDFDVVIPRVWGYVTNSAPVQGISKFGKKSWRKLQDYAVEKSDNPENWENSIDSEKSSSFGNVTINLSREDLEATLRNLRLPPRRSTSLLKSVGKGVPVRTSSLASISNKKISRNRALRRERSRLHHEFLKVQKTVDSEIEEEEEEEVEELVHKPTPSKKLPETPETLKFK